VPVATFSLVALDCPDPRELATFYGAITGWEIEAPAWLDVEAEGLRWLQLRSDDGATLAFQRIEDFVAPTWPGGEHPTQLHLDFDVPDLDVGEREVLALGARKAAQQPDPDEFRVYLDPVGHPFCLVRMTS
jgi:catechol 2,3-dioxygenase-like lactoylglutathione lyase family enzyme